MSNLDPKIVQELFTYNNGRLFWAKQIGRRTPIGKEAGCSRQGRFRIKIYGSSYLRSRLVFVYHNGYWPDYVDHVNRDPLDDRIENLRACNISQNNANRRVERLQSPYRGVQKTSPNRWSAKIKIYGKQVYLGVFKTPEEAKLAYEAKAREVYGEFVYDP